MEARWIARSPSQPAGAGLSRRSALLLPLVLAACAGGEPQYFPPLSYKNLPPIRLNVARIEVAQHFIPSGVPPDVTQFDPVHPTDALRAMANERLKAFGSTGYAVFVIRNASLRKQGDTITGNMDVMLNVYPAANAPRAGFAEARVAHQYSGNLDNLRKRLYDMTEAMMRSMNIEFEYQVRNRLHDWLVSGTAVVPKVQQQPLIGTSPPGTQPAANTAPPPSGMPAAATPPPPAAPAATTAPPPPAHALPPPVPMPPANS